MDSDKKRVVMRTVEKPGIILTKLSEYSLNKNFGDNPGKILLKIWKGFSETGLGCFLMRITQGF